MTEAGIHSALVRAVVVLAALTFISLLRFTAPYGRHYPGRGWGPEVSNRTGWIVMELPATLLFAVIYALGDAARDTVPLALLALWQCHYLNRTFIYPFRTRSAGKTMPLAVALSGFAFNVLNAYINARFISHIGEYGPEWLADPRFLAGAVLFFAGFTLNLRSDNILLALRKDGGAEYSVPRGGAFRYVSCPNYLGEILEWGGWALAAWSPAGLAFFLYAVANLAPRALSHHRWYRERFDDYPAERKALIPGVV
ncbi:MAG: DUF1295 domain-containing protein [Gemmatimonadetes bacterium]|nr:DUF1295 domain-containing protein [Gemmatimonadota bacterium]MYE69580.1 DUF1295 domain-containing protein [Gemmatimonadota bacterium]MYJ67777.1 DUF1295 domain-containing protein [Gemmatimonadota bacterium]